MEYTKTGGFLYRIYMITYDLILTISPTAICDIWQQMYAANWSSVSILSSGQECRDIICASYAASYV